MHIELDGCKPVLAGIEHANLTDKWFGHDDNPPLVARWEYPLKCNAEIERQERLHVIVCLAGPATA